MSGVHPSEHHATYNNQSYTQKEAQHTESQSNNYFDNNSKSIQEPIIQEVDPNQLMFRPELSAQRFENYEMEAAEMKGSMNNQFKSISDNDSSIVDQPCISSRVLIDQRPDDHHVPVIAQTDNSKFISFNDSQQLKQGQVTTFQQ